MDKLEIYDLHPEVPEETVIKFSQWKQGIYIFLTLLIIAAGGVWVLSPKDNPLSFSSILSYVVGTVFICFGGVNFWITMHDFLNRDVQMVIGNHGIKRLGGVYYSWTEIYDEKIIRMGSGRSTSFHLIYRCPGGLVDITLSGLNIGRTRLSHVLQVYRNRSILESKESSKVY
jgi:hypothetical protein